MPRVQPYSLPQVQQQGTPGGKMDPNAPAGAFGAGIGQGLQQAAGVLNDVAFQADTLRTEDSLTQLRQQQMDLLQGPDGASQRKGKDALNVAGEYLPQFDQASRDLSNDMSSPRQRRMFQQGAARLRLEFEGQLRDHENQQAAAYSKQVYQDGVTAETTNIGNAVRDDGSINLGSFHNSMARMEALTQSEAQRQGLDPEGTGNMVLGTKTNGILAALGGMLARNNPRGAQVLLEENQASLSPEARIAAQAQVTKALRGMQADLVVNDIWSAMGPRGDQDAVNRDAMSQEVRKRLANDPESQKLALAAIKDRAEEHDYSVKQREENTTGAIWKQVLAGAPVSAIRTMPEFRLNLDGTRQAKLLQEIDAFRRPNQDDPAMQVERNLAYYNAISDPNFPNLSDNAIRRLAPSLGPDRTRDLLKDLFEVRTDPNKWKALQVDQDQLKDRALRAGLISDKDNPTPGEKNLLSQLEYKVKSVKQATGRPWTFQDTAALIDKELEQVVVKTPWYRSDIQQRVFQVEDQVPKAFIQNLRSRAQQQGRREPTKAEIISTWLQARDRDLVDENGNPK